MITAPLLYSSDKNLKEIEHIVTSIKVANLAKHIISQTADLTMMAKKKQLEREVSQAKANEKYFHYEKKGYYTKDFYSVQKKKPKEEKSLEEAKRAQ